MHRILIDSNSRIYLCNFIVKGIYTSRLMDKGSGESQLLNDCTQDAPCSEDKKELNRRSKFVVKDKN